MASLDLADRFQALQTQKKTEEFQALSFQELSEMRVTFGEAKLNQKFIDVVEGDPKYTQWFARKYQNSQKESHQAFLYFLQLYVERKELEATSPKVGMKPKDLNLKPKAKVQPAPKRRQDTGSQGSLPDEETPWDMMHEEPNLEIREEMADNRRRLESMENVLAQITHQLRFLTQAAAVASTEQ
jgi:hypothetical protein